MAVTKKYYERWIKREQKRLDFYEKNGSPDSYDITKDLIVHLTNKMNALPKEVKS
tara:strand:+ start:671 stop:835 length:165 start_codon:yes stop_codon:yes gene_type:complete